MSDELKEILEDLKRGVRAEKSMEINTGNYIEDAIYDIERWHVRERKKWALRLLDKLYGTKDDILTEIRKRMEEKK